MSDGLNIAFMQATRIFLQQRSVTTALMAQPRSAPPGGMGPFDFDLSPVQAGGSIVKLSLEIPVREPAIRAYWLAQGGYIDIPKVGPAAGFVLTPELSGCKLYVDEIAGGLLRVFHIQGPHEATEYPQALRGERRGQIDAADYGGAAPIATLRANALLKFEGGAWKFFVQGLTGAGLGTNAAGGIVAAPGPQQVVAGMLEKAIG